MNSIAIIGGSGLTVLENLRIIRREVVHTPYGEPSSLFVHGEMSNQELVFLPRHGILHKIPPHKINYRANLWALKHIGIEQIISVNAVASISEQFSPASLAIPEQIIDYTYSRAHTFFENQLSQNQYINLDDPYNENLRYLILHAAELTGTNLVAGGTYGATQGPRMDTKAEIQRMEKDGCTMVGMTGMPEAALARELDLHYATIAVSANWAAGKGDGTKYSADNLQRNLKKGMLSAQVILQSSLSLLHQKNSSE